MSSTTPTLTNCLHCNSTLAQREIAEGWCDSCGKRLPSSATPTKAPRQVVAADGLDSLPESRGTWALICGVAGFAVLSMAALFALAG